MLFVFWALTFPKSMNFVTVQKRIQKKKKSNGRLTYLWNRLNQIHLILRKNVSNCQEQQTVRPLVSSALDERKKNASHGSQETKKKTPKNMPAPTVLI